MIACVHPGGGMSTIVIMLINEYPIEVKLSRGIMAWMGLFIHDYWSVSSEFQSFLEIGCVFLVG